MTTTVLAALDSNATARPVLSTAVAVAFVFDATVIALHVPENGTSGAEELAGAAGVELRELSGPPVDQIVAAAQDPDVAALVLGARGTDGGPQPPATPQSMSSRACQSPSSSSHPTHNR